MNIKTFAFNCQSPENDNWKRIDEAPRSASGSVVLKTKTIVENVSRTESSQISSEPRRSIATRKGRWSTSTSTMIRHVTGSFRKKKSSTIKRSASGQTVGLPPRPYNPEDSDSDSSSIRPLAQRLSDPPHPMLSWYPTTPQTAKDPLTPYKVYGGPGQITSRARLSAQRVLRKYRTSGMQLYPILPSYAARPDKFKPSTKSPGWSRHAQMYRELATSSKTPLSVRRTRQSLKRKESLDDQEVETPSTCNDGMEDSRGRQKEKCFTFIRKLRSRSNSRCRLSKVAPFEEVPTPNQQLDPVMSSNMIDLSCLPDRTIDKSTNMSLRDGVESGSNTRLTIAQHPHASRNENESTETNESASTTLVEDNLRATQNQPINSYQESNALAGSESLMIPDTQTERSSLTQVSDIRPTMDYIDDGVTQKSKDEFDESYMVPDSEIPFSNRSTQESISKDKDQFVKCPLRKTQTFDNFNRSNGTPFKHSSYENLAPNRRQKNDGRKPLAGTTSCAEFYKVAAADKELNNVRLQLSTDGSTVSFVRSGNIVRQVSAIDVWRCMESAKLLPPLSQTPQSTNEETQKSESNIDSSTVDTMKNVPLSSTLRDDMNTPPPATQRAEIIFTNKDLYCTDSEEIGTSGSSAQTVTNHSKKKKNHQSPKMKLRSSHNAESTPQPKESPVKSRHRKKNVIHSDDEEDTPINMKCQSLPTEDAESVATTQQRHCLYREDEMTESELNDLQALEKMIEAEVESDDGDTAVPESVSLPADDIVVRLTMGTGNKKEESTFLRPQRHSANFPKFEGKHENLTEEDESEPNVIPSSQDDLQSTVNSSFLHVSNRTSESVNTTMTPTSQGQSTCKSWSGETTTEEPPEEKTKKPRKPVHLIASGLRAEDRDILRKFCQMFEVSYKPSFQAGVTTHVVMREDGSRPLVVQRTLKFFLGILSKAWIVSFQWILDCLFARTLIDEDDYEIVGDSVCGVSHGGPRRARTIERPLFSGIHLCVVGELVDLSMDDFRLMVELGGGNFVAKPDDFPITRKRYIIVDRQNVSYSETACKALYKRYRIRIISRDWLFDSIARYRFFQPTGEYLIQPKSSN